ncbi:MAG: septal ring lytic transglycosylase RlpA family protein [Acidobacteria bacterium]|nr:septal ring lytic transglycosylase RlpA family protein [Acidobacteriota bacterium]MBW4045297.1 septal ring lytic transglycosylase RlpA family protein [Acidobacteriota bacterium]
MTRNCRLSFAVALASAAIFILTGCSHRRPITASAPPPPVLTPGPAAEPVPPAPGSEASPIGSLPAGNPTDAEFVASHKPVYSEVGMASWYGPPYHNRRAANGEIYDEHMLSAAHRTLPMGSLIRVTNLATGQSAVMRITDRGPFVPNRILDLSLASAKAVGVWRPGVAKVRVDVYAAPKPLDTGGRWCVQIGAFKSEHDATKLEQHLERKYHTANVIEFHGPTGYWVRIRPAADEHGRAVEIAKSIAPSEGEAYLVRLD